MSPRAEFFAGIRAQLPILLAVIPFGMIYGVLALQAGIPIAPALAMSSIVFAGSAQLAATQLFGLSAPALVIVLTAFVLNLRHLLYGAALGPYLRPLRPAWKWLLAYLLTDQTYAVSVVNYTTGIGFSPPPSPQRGEGRPAADGRHWFVLGAGIALWTTWQASTAVGIFLGAQIPAGWSLDFGLPLTFIALVRPTLVDRASLVAAAVAGVTVMLAVGAPLRLGLVIAALVGIAAGLLAERRGGTR